MAGQFARSCVVTTREKLAAVRDRADQAAAALDNPAVSPLEIEVRLAMSQADVPRLVSAVTAVLDEHRPVKRATWASSMPGYKATYREECVSCGSFGWPTYPCPTVHVVTAALEGGSS